MILTMPLPQMLAMKMTATATTATSQLVEALLMAEDDSVRPMAITMGPVTSGGKNFMTRSEPNTLKRAARMG